MKDREKNLETILIICIGLIVFFAIFHIKALLTISILVGLIGIFSDYLSAKITWLWLKFSTLLGEINGKVLLSVIYFVFLVPFALLMKLFGKVSFRLARPKSDSLFEVRNHTYNASDLEDLW